MRKYIIFMCTILFTLLLASCGKQEEEQVDSIDIEEKWGVRLETKDVTPTSLTIVCHQSGGENIKELITGSYYVIEKLKGKEYVEVKYLSHEYDIAWTAEAWIIELDSTVSWDVDWEWLYGELPAGKYRIGKEIMNFRESGDYDKEILYANFEIQ